MNEEKTKDEQAKKDSQRTGKTLAWSGGIIGTVILIFLVIFGYYNFTDLGNMKVFKVAGSDIGQYEAGSYVTAIKDFNHPLEVGKVVVYKQTDGGGADVMAKILEVKGEERYKVIRSRNREEIINFSQVNWLVTDTVY